MNGLYKSVKVRQLATSLAVAFPILMMLGACNGVDSEYPAELIADPGCSSLPRFPGGISLSRDHGESIARATIKDGMVELSDLEKTIAFRYVVSPHSPGTLVSFNNYKVFLSRDAGCSWSEIDRRDYLMGAGADAAAFIDDRVFVLHDGEEWTIFLRTTTFSGEQEEVYFGGPTGCLGRDCLSLSSSVTEPHSIYTYEFKEDRLRRSDDGGSTWVDHATGLPYPGRIAAIDPVDSDHMILAGDEAAVTFDGGETWDLVQLPLSAADQVRLVDVEISAESGVTWLLGERQWIDAGGLIETRERFIVRSIDGGVSGMEVATAGVGAVVGIHDIAVAPDRAGSVFFSEGADCSGNGILRIHQYSADSLSVVTHEHEFPGIVGFGKLEFSRFNGEVMYLEELYQAFACK